MKAGGTVSVIIPCYNAAPFLEEAFASIAAQTHPIDEVVVVDDGSSDGSAEAARKLGVTAGLHVRVIEQPNLGVSVARNTAIAAATGELIALLDADDVWHPEKIERQVAYLNRHPEVGTVVTSVNRFAERVERSARFIRVEDAMLRGTVPTDFLIHTWAHPSSILTRASILRATPYPIHTRDSEDMIHAAELRMAAPIGALPEVLTWYRYHEGQATRRSDHFEKSLRTRLDWAADHHARLGYSSAHEATRPILEFTADRVLDLYWRREIHRFKWERDRLIAFWPAGIPVPRRLTRFVFPRFLLRLRDLAS